jgi:hypothetical protein
VLAGVAAMVTNYTRRPAHGSGAPDLETSAADLRAILLYTGFAWGAGAFLALSMAPAPGLALVFCLAPALLATMLLKDEGGTLAFIGPLIVLTAAAALFQHWPDGRMIAPAILTAGIVLTLFSRRQYGRMQIRAGRGAV